MFSLRQSLLQLLRPLLLLVLLTFLVIGDGVDAFLTPTSSVTSISFIKRTTTTTATGTTTPSTTTSLSDAVAGSVESLVGKVMEVIPSTAGGVGGGAVGIPSSLPADPLILGGAAAALVVVGLIAAATSAASDSSGSGADTSTTSKKVAPEPEPEPIDVSIPYDAAAVLEYQKLKPEFSKAEYDEIVSTPDFQTFNTQYKDITASEIALKAKKAKFTSMFS